jgi:hypothetical protein
MLHDAEKPEKIHNIEQLKMKLRQHDNELNDLIHNTEQLNDIELEFARR